MSSSLIDLIESKTSDELARRKGYRQFEDIGDKISEDILPLLKSEGIQLDDGERKATALAVAETLNKSKLSSTILLQQNLQPTQLAKYMLDANPHATRDLSEAATFLYQRIVQECCTYIIDISSQLPSFTEHTFAEILRRDDLILKKVDQVLDDLHEIRKNLNPSDKADRFEIAYRDAVARNLDVLQLIGADVSLPNRRHRLSVAYITLSVAPTFPTLQIDERQPSENSNDESIRDNVSVDTVLATSHHLLIRGLAGSGKTTLLQWIAVKAARKSFALAARRLRTFKTTFVSQSIGLLALLAFGTIAFWRWHLPLTLTTLSLSALIGIFTGLCAALGYFAFYRALEIGPIAIVSPISATSSTFTLMLSILILQEQLTPGRIGLFSIVILGLILASTSLAELRALLKKPGFSLWNQGVRWAIVATLAFGAMDFGIGASASISGWFLPVLWTRFFSILFLTLASLWKRQKRLTRTRMTTIPASGGKTLSLSLPTLEDIAHLRYPFSQLGLGVLLAFIAGMLENAAVLTFSFDTRIATTGITSAISSSYALVVMIFGMMVYRERLTKNQLFGIAIFMIGLVLLAA